MRNKEQTALRKRYTAQFYQNNHFCFTLSLIAMFLTAAVNLALSWLVQQIIDSVAGTAGALTLAALAKITVGIMVGILAFKGLLYVSRPRFMRRAMRQYKAFAFEKLMKKSIASFQEEPTARYLSAFSNDAARIETDYLDSIYDLILYTVLFAGALAMMLLYSPLMTAVSCAFLALPMLVSLVAGKKIEPMERKISDNNESFLAALKDSLSGFPVIKSFKAERALIRQFDQVNAAVEQAKCEKRRLETVVSTLAGITGVAAQIAPVLIGGWLVLSGYGLSIGELSAFLTLTAYIINPIQQLPTILASRKAASSLIDKLAQELEANVRDTGRPIPQCLERGIELRNVSFGYEAGNEILHGINAVFEAGKSYAIVGASGSGKSTLLNLLMASHSEYTGEIRYDETELRDIHSDSLYDVVSMIGQNVFVFDASIRDNVTMFQSFDDSQVDRAIQLAGLSALMREKGTEYLCGENGKNLSGGEKQRISIARSLLRKSAVLLADEATSALDAQTARQVSDAILRLDGLTRIVVTHTLDEAVLKRYDCILVLKDGRIEEFGGFDVLMERRAYFYSLYTVSR